ncbi:hypothetical protein JCM8547_006628 [Rhodosporidiobolus lusitaniae]
MATSRSANAARDQLESTVAGAGQTPDAPGAAVPLPRFPTEIYTSILSCLDEWADLAACYLVSRSFLSISRLLLYCDVSLDVCVDQNTGSWSAFTPSSDRLAKTLLQPQNVHLASLVHSLEISAEGGGDRTDGFWDAFCKQVDQGSESLEPVVDLLEKLPELERFQTTGSQLSHVTELWEALSRLPKVEEVVFDRAWSWFKRVEVDEAFEEDEEEEKDFRKACKKRGIELVLNGGSRDEDGDEDFKEDDDDDEEEEAEEEEEDEDEEDEEEQ